MYQMRIPKSQKAYSSVYVCYNPHSKSLAKRQWPAVIRVISVDPGISNFCIRVEERNIRQSGEIRTLLFEKMHLMKNQLELDESMVCSVYTILSQFLDAHLELFKTCHMLIVEKQLPQNYKAVRISQHVLTYFMVTLKDIPTMPMIFELDPKLKGKELGAPPYNSKGLKMWAVQKATELLTMRKDYYALGIMKKHKKKADDLADTVCQIEALFSLHDWPITVERKIIKAPKKIKLNIT